MATEVKLPRLGQGMESGTIVRWLKGEGDTVRRSEPLYELDTDKVTQEVEAEADGVLLRILVADGEVEVGTTVALIGAEGEDASAAAAPEPVADQAASAPTPAPPEAAATPAPRRCADACDCTCARPDEWSCQGKPSRAAHGARARRRSARRRRNRA